MAQSHEQSSGDSSISEESSKKPRTTEQLAAVVSVLALLVSLGAAYFSYRQADRAANKSDVERARDDLNHIAALSANFLSQDAEQQNIALAQIKLQAAEAAELMRDREGELSAVELATLASALLQTSQPDEAQRVLTIALHEHLDPTIRIDVLNLAARNDLVLGHAKAGRRKLEVAYALATPENFHEGLLLRDAQGRAVNAQLEFELLARDCGRAADRFAAYAALLENSGLDARVEDYRTRVAECQSQ